MKITAEILDSILKYGPWFGTIIIGLWARHKFNKQHDFNKNIELLKSQLAQGQTILNSALNSLFVERQASQERRIVAVENIWKEVISIRQQFSSVAFFYSILVPDEYNTEFEKHPIVDLDKIESSFAETWKADLEVYRPFIGEKLWFAFWTYRAFQYRVALTLAKGGRKMNIQDWRKDKLAIEHLSNILGEKELNYTKNFNPTGSLTVAINLIEYKILEEIHSLISGEKAAENSYKNAIRFAEAVVNVSHSS